MTESEANKIWERWYPLVYGYFFRRINKRQDVEEMTANTISSLILKEGVTNPQAFTWQTARNQLKLYYTKKAKQPGIVNIEDLSLETESFKHSDKVYSENYLAFINRLKDCLSRNLSDLEKKIVNMAVVEEEKSNYIAETLNLKPATVRQKLRRSILKLKEKCVGIWSEYKQK